jgi:uncharacterized protein YecT (DUF1311 family)
MRIAFLLLMLGLAAPAAASDRATDAAEFKGFVEVCTANPDERGLDGCIADQVGAKDSYLGDILAETDGPLTPAQSKRLAQSQAAFVAYRQLSCAYQLAATGPAGRQSELFCLLRLTNQRIADVLEGSDFLSRTVSTP